MRIQSCYFQMTLSTFASSRNIIYFNYHSIQANAVFPFLLKSSLVFVIIVITKWRLFPLFAYLFKPVLISSLSKLDGYLSMMVVERTFLHFEQLLRKLLKECLYAYYIDFAESDKWQNILIHKVIFWLVVHYILTSSSVCSLRFQSWKLDLI